MWIRLKLKGSNTDPNPQHCSYVKRFLLFVQEPDRRVADSPVPATPTSTAAPIVTSPSIRSLLTVAWTVAMIVVVAAGVMSVATGNPCHRRRGEIPSRHRGGRAELPAELTHSVAGLLSPTATGMRLTMIIFNKRNRPFVLIWSMFVN